MTFFSTYLEQHIYDNLRALLDVEEEVTPVKVVVALSGGPDSVCLLKALRGAGEKRLQVIACHVNHQIRDNAARDQEFCQKLCSSLAVDLTVVALDKDTMKNSSERVLRDHRYRAITAVAQKEMVSYVVTAHTASDQLETMLFRLCRGTSSRGLSGIKARRSLAPGVEVLRPMLDLNKKQILAFLNESDQPFCLDESNSDSRYTRNFLRNEILPSLRTRFPSIEQSFERLRISSGRDEEYFSDLARSFFAARINHKANGISLADLGELHEAIRARIFVLMMENAGVEPTFARVEKCGEVVDGCLLAPPEKPKRWSLGNDIDIAVTPAGMVSLSRFEGLDAAVSSSSSSSSSFSSSRSACTAVSLRLPGAVGRTVNTIVPWLDRAIRIEAMSGSAVCAAVANNLQRFPHRQAHDAMLDLGKVAIDSSGADSGVVLRLREDGDCIQPLGMAATVRLKKYLHVNGSAGEPSQKLLSRFGDDQARRLTPVISAAGSREVLWVPGFGLSEKVRVRPDSEVIYHFSLLQLSN